MAELPSDKQNLQKLLDDFGSVVSLHDIASAYCRSGRDLDAAGEILFNLQGTASMAPPPTLGEEPESTDKSPSNDSLERATPSKLKHKNVPASMGTVSSIIGKDYVRPRPSTNEVGKAKPLKLNSNDIPMSEIWDEKESLNSMSTNETLHNDIVEFLFKMLGDGFQLERSVIQDIIGQCGYDVNKSMEKLLNLSASALENNNDIMKVAPDIPTKNFINLEYMQQAGQFPDAGSSGSSTYILKDEKMLQYPNKEEKYDLCKESFRTMFTIPEKSKEQVKSGIVKQVWIQKASDLLIEEPLNEATIKCLPVTKNESQLPDVKDVSDLQKEVLGSLFCVPERLEKKAVKTRPVKSVPRRGVYGQLVERPLEETTIEYQPIITRVQTMMDDDEENGDDYEGLRKAVMKYWSTMKVYYKSAVDAFVKQDHERAQKLLNEGHFFMEKAREADERSAQMLLGGNVEEDMFIDLQDHDPREALRLLKVQLVSLSGISSFKHLKVLAGSKEENPKHGLRKRVIIKLLDREDIRWIEEGDGWTIAIPLADIDPRKLRFSKR